MYSTNIGMVLGKLAGQGSRAAFHLRDMRVTGTTDKTIISENFMKNISRAQEMSLEGVE